MFTPRTDYKSAPAGAFFHRGCLRQDMGIEDEGIIDVLANSSLEPLKNRNMEFSIEDKIIDILINNLEYGKFMPLPTSKIIEAVGLENADLFDLTFKVCEDINLIDRKEKRTYGVLLLDGFNVQREGGWLKYLERKELERLKELERQNKADQILDLELKLKNFEAKNGRRMLIAGFIITVLSFLISILNVQFYQPDENKDLQKDLKEKPIQPKKL